MKSTFRVLFFLKRDKVKKNGNMPIMARITIDGRLAQFNTKLEVNLKNWQAKTGSTPNLKSIPRTGKPRRERCPDVERSLPA